ncbi:MAG: response regulator transcription factor [Prevotella sp.]|nr:response regulator transcription factor [Prevotella sp.]
MNFPRQTKVFIVDDNPSAIELLRRMLLKDYSVDIAGTAVDAETAIENIITSEPDLIFLDVELPTMTGMELLDKVRSGLKSEAKVVFYTGHDKYMLDAIRQQAFDYLMKPPTERDLAQLMTRFYENRLAGIPQHFKTQGHLPIIIVINEKNEHVTLHLGDIAFFRFSQQRKLWEVVCVNKSVFALRHRTTAEIILNYSPDLVQIHKRYIVNTNKIKLIKGVNCILKEPMDDISELKISKNYRSELMFAFYSL